MGWTLIIKALLEATTEYLKLRSKTFYLDIFHKSHDKQDDYIKEIENLRANRTSSNVERIDTLMLRLQQERSRLNDISTFYIKTDIKSDN